MDSLILFDDNSWHNLLPLTYTKPTCELRLGILTIREKWEKHLGIKASYITQDFLSEKFPITIKDDNLILNSAILPSPELVELLKGLSTNEALLSEDELIAARIGKQQLFNLIDDNPIEELKGHDIGQGDIEIRKISRPYDLFEFNGDAIVNDYNLITKGRKSSIISNTNRVLNFDNIFVEEGAEVEFSILNASEGPIYIGQNAKILEGSIVRGPLAVCEGAIVKMGAKIYSKTTIGPYCKAGGEINNSILSAYTNKGHDGYLGNSVIGEWCNLGADSNTSNLKNNYEIVKMWNYVSEKFEKSGLQFCGLIMGDHSKCGINSMFNCGSVVGVNANIFGSGYPRMFIPSFSWGGNKGFITYQIEKALSTASKAYERKNVSFTSLDAKILKHIFYYSARWRNWEK